MIEYLKQFYDVKEEKYSYLEEKRKAAIEKMGKNWILHPEYEFNPKHSMSGYNIKGNKQ